MVIQNVRVFVEVITRQRAQSRDLGGDMDRAISFRRDLKYRDVLCFTPLAERIQENNAILGYDFHGNPVLGGLTASFQKERCLEGVKSVTDA